MKISEIIRRLISLLIISCLVITGCSARINSENMPNTSDEQEAVVTFTPTVETGPEEREYHLDDPRDLAEYSELVYQNIVEQLNSEDIFVEEVNVAYYSEEYLEDVFYNSKESVFFGYTSSELDNQFKGKKYAFSVNDSGATEVHEFENYDFTTETIIKNVAIGTGVIIVCAVVTYATSGATTAGAVVVVNQVAAKMTEGAIATAVSGAVVGGLTSGIITGLETHDMNAAVKSAAFEASKSYKWGAITGAVTGGVSEGISLAWASGGGVSVSEAALIQSKSKLPSSFIRKLSSIDEYYELLEIEKNGGLAVAEVAALCEKTKYPPEIVKLFRKAEEGDIYFKDAKLFAKQVNGKLALVRDIDLDYQAETAGKMMTNLERMRNGYAALDSDGNAYQLHHIGQDVNSPLAILTQAEHMGGGNNSLLHDVSIANGEGVHSLLPDKEWAIQRENFWIALAELLGGQ